MNLKTFDKSTRILKQADLAVHGQPLQGNTNTTVIGILDCTQNSNPTILQNLICGIRQAGGCALTFNLSNFNTLQRLAPATAKYAYDYHNMVANNTAGLVRTQMLDGVVALVDNCIMGLGVLLGCTQTNCPVLIMSNGIIENYDNCLLTAAGKIATREIKAGEIEKVADNYRHQNGAPLIDTLTIDFYSMLSAFDLTIPSSTETRTNTGTSLNEALTAAATIVQMANDIITPKRLISKRTLNENLTKYHGSASGIFMFQKIFAAVDVKVTPSMFTSLKTNFSDQAYTLSGEAAPLTINGQAWVYNSIADAVTALSSNAIDNGVVVLQNCTACDVSIVAHTIAAMNKTHEIALLTDGFCSATPVLTIGLISPDGYANQDFANIQNGDNIEIDVTKGRINLNVSSKDMKMRAKRNTMKKRESYF